MMSSIKIGIIGAGNITKEHLNVIRAIDKVEVAGITSRTISKAKLLAFEYNIEGVYDNLDALIENLDFDALMVLVSADQIFEVTKKIIPLQIPVFLEKPPGLVPEQTKTLLKLADKYGTKNMVGYNRRYYSIFHKGLDLINNNGGLLGICVEGHERFWKIVERGISNKIQENWIYCNSTHTIDLLHFFGGEIKSISSLSKSIKEKNGDQFVASMEFESGTLGTYVSHWFSPGGWTVTLYSRGITVKFKPLEKGVWIDTDFTEYEILPDKVDLKYKPGFYRQMKSFVKMVRNGRLETPGMNLEHALKTMELAKEFAND